MRADLPPLAVSIGDPSGIGPDVAIAAWLNRRSLRLPPFYLLADPYFIESRARKLGWDLTVATVASGETRSAFDTALPVVALAARFDDTPGQPDSANAAGIIEAIDQAVEDTLAGRAAAVVTCPIAKKVLYEAGFGFPGHTEYLAHLAHAATGVAARPVMMLAGPELRTIPVTIHIPVTDVAAALTTEAIVETGKIAAAELKHRFGIAEPRLAIAGLNPHAGEGGTIGTEDEMLIRPAVDALRRSGINVTGPLPADTMFHERARKTYDVAICMYHDQALIPAKALAFDEAVNVTLGLPFIRTSPDHGTAFDLAGRGTARPDSLVAALRLAWSMASRQ